MTWAEQMHRVLAGRERQAVDDLEQALREAEPGEIVHNDDWSRGGIKLTTRQMEEASRLRPVRGWPHDRLR